MMKKLLLLGSAVFFLSFGAKSQFNTPSLKTAATATTVVDTLHYYLNKYYFKTGNTTYTTYPYFRSDATALTTYTDVSFCGSRFDVPAGDSVLVTGAEAFVSREGIITSINGVAMRLYLFKLDMNTNLPIWPAIDSVSALAIGNEVPPRPRLIGGNFTGTATAAARVMKSSYVICVRNVSVLSGDWVHILRTPCTTPTMTNGYVVNQYSDSYGYVRHNGKFYSTKNFNAFPGFGVGTDFEFMVAPRVQYDIYAGHQIPNGVYNGTNTVTPDTMCTRTVFTFTNQSSPFYQHPQYNLNQFYHKWNGVYPYLTTNGFSTDSALAWSFEFYDIEQPPRKSSVNLPYSNNGTISAQTGISFAPDCFTANQFRARLKPMSAFGRGTQLSYNDDFKICLKYCNDDAVGIKSNGELSNLKVYPNPMVNGRTMITGLEGKNQVMVYNTLGQNIFTISAQNSSEEINLAGYATGTYMVKIINEKGQTKMVKIMNQN